MHPKLIPILKNTGLDIYWEKSSATFPGDLPFLHPDTIRENGDWANLPPDAIDFAIRAAQKIASDPDLALMAWHAHRLLFIDKKAARDLAPPLAHTRQLRRRLLSPHRALGHSTTPHIPPIAQHP